MRLSWRAVTDVKFLVWSAWFWYNSLLSSRAQYNHQSCRLLAWLSLKCREEEEREFGERVEMNKTALETIKLFHDKREMADFLSSSQVVEILRVSTQISDPFKIESGFVPFGCI